MGNYKVFTSLLATIVFYLVFVHDKQVGAAPGTPANVDASSHRVRSRPFIRLAARPIVGQYARFKPDLGDFIVDDDDFFELNKRQTSDDYGHLRFGKRDEFDDYGHMRFGRSDPDSSGK